MLTGGGGNSLLLRRRMMMQGISGGEPEPAGDGKVWVYYNVTDTSAATVILNTTTGLGSTMIVDGVNTPLATSYQFTTTGEHLIKYTFTGASWGTQLNGKKTFTKVYFPVNVTTIGQQAFQNTSIKECHGKGVRTIGGSSAGWGGGAFTNVTSLLVADFPNVTTIQTGGMYNCTNLNTFIGIENITSLANYGLANAALLVLNLTMRVTSLTKYTLSGGGWLSLNLPLLQTLSGAAGSGDAPLGNLRSVVSADFGENFTSTGAFFLAACPALKTVTVRAVTPPTTGSSFLYNSNNITHIYVPAESVDAYKAAAGWSSKASIISAIPT